MTIIIYLPISTSFVRWPFKHCFAINQKYEFHCGFRARNRGFRKYIKNISIRLFREKYCRFFVRTRVILVIRSIKKNKLNDLTEFMVYT